MVPLTGVVSVDMERRGHFGGEVESIRHTKGLTVGVERGKRNQG